MCGGVGSASSTTQLTRRVCFSGVDPSSPPPTPSREIHPQSLASSYEEVASPHQDSAAAEEWAPAEAATPAASDQEPPHPEAPSISKPPPPPPAVVYVSRTHFVRESDSEIDLRPGGLSRQAPHLLHQSSTQSLAPTRSISTSPCAHVCNPPSLTIAPPSPHSPERVFVLSAPEAGDPNGWAEVVPIAAHDLIGGEEFGFVPFNFLDVAHPDGVMLADFQGETPKELAAASLGEGVWLIDPAQGSINGWLEVTLASRQRGSVPETYVEWRSTGRK
jgi:hypothetical protein